MNSDWAKKIPQKDSSDPRGMGKNKVNDAKLSI